MIYNSDGRDKDLPNLFTWEMWQSFGQKVEAWYRGISAVSEKHSRSYAAELLSLPACDLALADHKLPPAKPKENIYGYFLRVCPSHYRQASRAEQMITETFEVALDDFIKTRETELHLKSVIAKAQGLRRAGKTPDDL
ncbi:MAG: hypothetical protein NTY30_01715 [Candidatus Berkelbacteria bacterium]|nr:hypothetical protein [Candidatus Berkelbacteria bacterium]